MRVSEIFASIQGESSWAGLPCAFVRLTGCNLSCAYCDTEYAREGGTEMTLDEIVTSVHALGIGLIEITGGEPLIHPETPSLVTALLDIGHGVLIETNGSVGIGGIDRRAVLIMDIKAPSSRMHDKTDMGNLALLKPEDEVKFVISDRPDYEWARDFMSRHMDGARYTVLFSPAFGVLDPAELAGWIMEDRLRVRLNLQLHKYIFGPDRRGV